MNDKFKYKRFDLQKVVDEYGGILEFDEGFRLLFEHLESEFERYLNTIDK